MMQLANKSVLVLGLGETGLSMLRYLKAQGAHVSVADSRIDPPGLAEAKKHVIAPLINCGQFDDDMFIGMDLIAISPGVPLSDPAVARAKACGIPVVGDIELFAQHLNDQPSRPRIIAITGANGKTTVTSMVEHMCRAAGKDAVAAGNISPAVLDVLSRRGGKQPQIWVLELSSFQLETTATLKTDAATVLNISEDHLDRYAGMEEYCAAKARIYDGAAIQVLNRDDVRCMEMALPGDRGACVQIRFGLNAPKKETDFGIAQIEGEVWLMQGTVQLIKYNELKVAGMHNAANALAALALCRAIDLPMEVLLGALRDFKGLPHRVERVAEIADVIY
jgi:UDP-N-acetylmuramoylalanine--D-glutamate ligase